MNDELTMNTAGDFVVASQNGHEYFLSFNFKGNVLLSMDENDWKGDPCPMKKILGMDNCKVGNDADLIIEPLIPDGTSTHFVINDIVSVLPCKNPLRE
jgi:hypothetical protein